MTNDGASNVSDDDRLLGELRRLVSRVDPVPDEVTAYAKAALGWRRIDAELAELLSDSVLEPDSLAITRGDGSQARRLTFRSGRPRNRPRDPGNGFRDRADGTARTTGSRRDRRAARG